MNYTQFIGCEVMKKSGKPFKGKSYFCKIVGLTQHPYHIGQLAFTLDNNTLVSVKTCLIILSPTELFLDGKHFVINEDVEIKGEVNIKTHRIIGKYLIRAGFVEYWNFDGFLTKPRVKNINAIHAEASAYQARICGPTETLIEADRVSFWADGIYKDAIYEVKHVSDEEKNPYCGNMPNSVQKKVNKKLIRQFQRIQYIIDNSNEFNRVVLVTNSYLASDYLSRLLVDVGNVEFEVIE